MSGIKDLHFEMGSCSTECTFVMLAGMGGSTWIGYPDVGVSPTSVRAPDEKVAGASGGVRSGMEQRLVGTSSARPARD